MLVRIKSNAKQIDFVRVERCHKETAIGMTIPNNQYNINPNVALIQLPLLFLANGAINVTTRWGKNGTAAVQYAEVFLLALSILIYWCIVREIGNLSDFILTFTWRSGWWEDCDLWLSMISFFSRNKEKSSLNWSLPCDFFATNK